MTSEQPASIEKRKHTLRGAVKMLLIFIGEEDKHDHMPLYEAIVRRLRQHGATGATVLRGIMGYGAQNRIYGTSTLGIAENRPVTIVVVENDEKINALLPEIDDLVKEGLVVVIDAFVQKYSTGLPEKSA